MKLHEAIALRKGEVGRNQARLTEVNKAFGKAPIFNGFTKSYERIDDEGELLPSENKRVQRSVENELGVVRDSLNTLWSTVGSVEAGNREASANIDVNGQVIAENVPVTTLLFLETQLTNLRTCLENIPTLSPDFEWTKDANDGLFKTGETKTHRNVKHTRAIVKYPHSEQHPAQTELIEEPKLAGYWNSVQHSGAMQSTRKAVLTSRVEIMLDAVKSARARANGSEAPDVSFSPILDFIFA